MDGKEIFCVEIIQSWIRADYDASIKSKRICGPSSERVYRCASKTEDGLIKMDKNCKRLQQDRTVEGILADMIATSKSYFVLDEPDRSLGHPCSAPPPTLHTSTRWRLLARKT